MTILLFLILAVGTVIYMATPLFWERFWPFLDGSAAGEIRRAKREGLWAISDIDSEYEMGKITEGDYASLRGRLKSDLMEAMKREREVLGGAGAEESEELPHNLKRKLLFEVLRICGLKRR